MKIERNMTHQATPQAVFEVLTNPEFVTAKCERSEATSFTCNVETAGESTVVSDERVMPVDDLPDLLKRFAAGGITVRERIEWGAPAADGSRTASVALDFLGQPMKMRGTMELTPTAGGAQLSVRAELKATIPLLGGKIEQLTAPVIYAAMDEEEALGREWLAR